MANYEPRITIISQYEQISSLAKFVKSKFVTNDDSEPESHYETDEDDEETRTWFVQKVFLSNDRHNWAARIVEKVEKKIIKVKERLLEMPTENTGYRHLDTKVVIDKMFTLILHDLETTREMIKKVKPIRPDIDESDYVETIEVLSKNERKLLSSLNTCKATLKKLLREAQNYYDYLTWGKKLKLKYQALCSNQNIFL